MNRSRFTTSHPVMSTCKGSMVKTGMVKTGAKCERKALANGYCGYHKAQANKQPSCTASVQKSETQCTRPAHGKAQADTLAAPPEGEQPKAAKQSKSAKQSKATDTLAAPPEGKQTRSRRAAAGANPKQVPVSRRDMVCAIADERMLQQMKQVVDLHSTYDKIFIGKASGGNPPEKRWSRKYEPMGYERMEVLCRVPTVEGALWLEKELIAHFKLVDGVNIQNPIAGGGGAKGKDPGYVYLVLG